MNIAKKRNTERNIRTRIHGIHFILILGTLLFGLKSSNCRETGLIRNDKSSVNNSINLKQQDLKTNNNNFLEEAIDDEVNKAKELLSRSRIQHWMTTGKHPMQWLGEHKEISAVSKFSQQFDDFSPENDSFDRHPCRRNCQKGQSQNCYYRLVVHGYQRFGPECVRCQYDVNACSVERCIYGDGVRTPVMAVNYQTPGPSIEVCENDTVIVDVLNYLQEETVIHWHGIHMTRTPEADGAPFITQYPIHSGEVYRYAFKVERSGSVWYHSHSKWQRCMGIAGSLIIRQPSQDNLQGHLYDYDLIDHTLMVQDIVYNANFNRVTNILINGKGRNHLTPLPDNDTRHRYERVRVTPGYRYRMRVISNGIFNCPIEFSIENHRMLIISTDGNDIVPTIADSFFMASGERFDFVIEANQRAANYWIRVQGYGNCSQENLYQGAVLHYRGAPRNVPPQAEIEVFVNRRQKRDDEKTEREGDKKKIVLNYLEEYSSSKEVNTSRTELQQKTENVPTAALRAIQPLPWPRYTKFLKYYSSLGSRILPDGSTIFQIDDITYQPPNVSLLQARHLINEDLAYCNRSSLAINGLNCIRTQCQCTNVLRLPAFKPIEMVMVNYDEISHPFHIHGYTFRVIGQGVIGNEANLRRIQDLDNAGALHRSDDDFPAVQKDTIQIPGYGYIIVRFLSNNPGYWMIHCHIEEHTVGGMVAIIKIGQSNQIKSITPNLRC